MSLGNYTVFRAKHIEAFKFSGTALTNAEMSYTTATLAQAYTTSNPATLLDVVGDADTANPTISYPFAKDFSVNGNERATSEENLLGADSQGSQNQETNVDPNTRFTVETTLVYRNVVPLSIFNDSTRIAMIQMDNSESATTGQVTIMFTNITVEHAGSLVRNSDGNMEQKIKFSCRGGTSGSAISVTASAQTWVRYRAGLDYAEEIRLT